MKPEEKMNQIKSEYAQKNMELGEVVQNLAILESRKLKLLSKIKDLHEEAAKLQQEIKKVADSGNDTETGQ